MCSKTRIDLLYVMIIYLLDLDIKTKTIVFNFWDQKLSTKRDKC